VAAVWDHEEATKWIWRKKSPQDQPPRGAKPTLHFHKKTQHSHKTTSASSTSKNVRIGSSASGDPNPPQGDQSKPALLPTTSGRMGAHNQTKGICGDHTHIRRTQTVRTTVYTCLQTSTMLPVPTPPETEENLVRLIKSRLQGHAYLTIEDEPVATVEGLCEALKEAFLPNRSSNYYRGELHNLYKKTFGTRSRLY